jgi:hypothetical protein
MTDRFVVQRVERFPLDRADGVIYLSERFRMASHRCACGCGFDVDLLLGDGHRISGSDEAPTVSPSIGVWGSPCKSHYWIRSGRVDWAAKMSNAEIAASWEAQLARHSQPPKQGRFATALKNIIRAFKSIFWR